MKYTIFVGEINSKNVFIKNNPCESVLKLFSSFFPVFFYFFFPLRKRLCSEWFGYFIPFTRVQWQFNISITTRFVLYCSWFTAIYKQLRIVSYVYKCQRKEYVLYAFANFISKTITTLISLFLSVTVLCFPHAGI